jgi:hypothetical protein
MALGGASAPMISPRMSSGIPQRPTPVVLLVCYLLEARCGSVDEASLRSQLPRGVEEIEGRGSFKCIRACEANMTRHLLAAYADEVEVEEEELEVGHEMVLADALPRSHARTAEDTTADL